MEECVFCKMVTGDIPMDFLYEDDHVIVFPTNNPEAPTHVLIVPKEHIPSVARAEERHEPLLGHLFTVARHMGKELSLEGYKTLINVEKAGGQEVFHIHMHVMGGAPLEVVIKES